MELQSLAEAAFFTFFTGGLGLLFWRRLDRIEERLNECVTKDELRSEMGMMRSEMAIMRSDLTQVALAVGARPRKATP